MRNSNRALRRSKARGVTRDVRLVSAAATVTVPARDVMVSSTHNLQLRDMLRKNTKIPTTFLAFVCEKLQAQIRIGPVCPKTYTMRARHATQPDNATRPAGGREATPLSDAEQFARNVHLHLEWEVTGGKSTPPPASFYDELDRRLSGPTGGGRIAEKIRLAGLPEADHSAELPLD